MEEKLISMYEGSLLKPHKSVMFCGFHIPIFVQTECRQALKASCFLGFGHALNDALTYFLIATVYWFGAFLIALDDDHFLHLEFDDLYT